MLMVRHQLGTVGSLSVVERALEFAYSASWLSHPRAFPLSPRMPLDVSSYRGEEVMYFFANLLPEGPVLSALCQLRSLPRGNVYRMLEAFGRECAGAFELIPIEHADDRAPEDYQAYSLKAIQADLADLRRNIPLLHRHGELRLSLAGAQNKIPVRYSDGKLFLPMNGAPSTHILKPTLQPESEFPDAVRNEGLSLRLAGALGIPVPNTLVLENPAPLLLIERYDRVDDGDRIVRLHQLDLCQLVGALPDQKYEADGGPGFKEAFAMIDAHSQSAAVDRLQLVDVMLYNYLIGNADAHGKNISMRYGLDGKLRIAPAYDLLSTVYWPTLSDQMAMAIGGERRPAWTQARHWQRLCDSVGLNITQLRKRANTHTERALLKLPRIADELGITHDSRLLKHWRKTLEQRGERMRQRIAV